MSTRIHIVVDAREHDAFRARARAEGQSLSEWLRQAAKQRLDREGAKGIRTPSDLQRFFEECDAREVGQEPEWPEHLAVIERSRISGLDIT